MGGVQKATLKTSKDLPEWYLRIVRITIKEYREIEPEDFDEDISELGESEGDSESDSEKRNSDCECDEWMQCDCDSADRESEKSYTGSDADFYYELKEQRIDRKVELLEEARRYEEQKKSALDFETRKEEEVYTAYEAIKEAWRKGDSLDRPVEFHDPVDYDLYCANYVRYCYNDLLYCTKYVEFHPIEPEQDGKFHGHIYFHAYSHSNDFTLQQPKVASGERIPLTMENLDLSPSIQFISDKYLLLSIRTEADIISNDIQDKKQTNIPGTFTFVGVRKIRNKRKFADIETKDVYPSETLEHMPKRIL